TCPERLYHDGAQCDCGCGAPDPDCDTKGIDSCDRCDSPGSCSALACPGLVSSGDNTRCTQPPPPDGWTCSYSYGDGHCDCGCGVQDIDCRTTDVTECTSCTGCTGDCKNLMPGNTLACKPPPSGWLCSVDQWDDFTCDCGCGVLDAGCFGVEAAYDCGNFPVEGCSGGNQALIQQTHNELCIADVPSAWTCNRAYFGDGVCDCGCGATDADCPNAGVGVCDNCKGPGSCSTAACPGTIQADDNAHCTH
ncbi:MAG TPA: hypothetical protein VG963_08350, partial [Polyangiaceae bacterium]|nr:hypothetical protein [Polyangiaceae bacterium]